MKITIEIPNTTACAFFNYVYSTSIGMNMASRQIDTDEIQSGEVIVCNPDYKAEKKPNKR